MNGYKSCAGAGCKRLLTEDPQSRQRADGLVIENPFSGS